MTRAFERRAQRTLGTTKDLMARSKWIIWCFEPEKMPAMIDLLIAQGTLSESDRPHCVHWTAVRPPLDDMVKTIDADEMLQKAGIRTLILETYEVCLQGPDVLKAFWRDWFGELDARHLEQLEVVERWAQTSPRVRERWAALARPAEAVPACK